MVGIETARGVMIGTLYLSSAYLISRIIDAVGTVIVARLLLPADYGLITFLFSIPSLLLVFSDLRLGVAATKYISEYLSTDRVHLAERVVRDYLISKVWLSSACLILSYVFAFFLSSRFFESPEIFNLFVLASLTIFGNAFSDGFESVFMGYQRLEFVLMIKIIFSLGRAILAPILLALGFGPFGAVLGYVLPGFISTFVAVFLLTSKILSGRKYENLEDMETGFFRRGIRYGVPITISALIQTTYLRSLPIFLAYSKGFEEVAFFQLGSSAMSLLAGALCHAPASVLLPTFSGLNAKKEEVRIQKLFSYSIILLLFLLAPILIISGVASDSLIRVFFSSKYYPATVPMLILLAGLPSLVLFWINRSFYLAIGDTTIIVKTTALSVLVGFLTNWMLAPPYGSLGTAFSVLLFYSTYAFIYTIYSENRYSIRTPVGKLAKILAVSVILGIIMYLVRGISTSNDVLRILLLAVLGMVTYLPLSFVAGSIGVEEIDYLENLLQETVLQRPIEFVSLLIHMVKKGRR